MPSLAVVRAANAKFSPSYIPVALFVGGTSGIGRAMAERFAHYTKGNAHIIICGRNRAAAESIIKSFPTPTVPEGAERPLHEFVQCDATLMKNVHATTTELLSRLPKLNFLVLSAGFLTLRGRDETEEGIDKKFALNYYARWKFTNDLMPLLRKAKDGGEDANVFSILGAGKGGKINVDDLDLKKTYSLMNAALAASTYNDLMMEEFARQQPDIAFTHIYPGVVRTPIIKRAARPLSPIITGLLYPFSVSSSVCAEHMLWALFDGKNGMFRRGEKGDDIGRERYFGSEEERKKLWEHTVQTVKV